MNDKLFWYWIKERQKIFLKRKEGKLRPWTKDKILQEYKFTNVFRQQDAVTIALTKRKRDTDSRPQLFFRICVFRMFNWPNTYDKLNEAGLIKKWDEKKAKKVLRQMKKDKLKIFTGAYIITNAGSTRPKIDLMAEALTAMWDVRTTLPKSIEHCNSIEYACKQLALLPQVGKFIAYELATDFVHTRLLMNAEDRYIWANPGPGAMRGLNRIFRGGFQNKKGAKYIGEMHVLLDKSAKKLPPHWGRLEMRDIEHSLCEFDKYSRVLNGEGRPRSKYDGTSEYI